MNEAIDFIGKPLFMIYAYLYIIYIYFYNIIYFYVIENNESSSFQKKCAYRMNAFWYIAWRV